MGFIYSCGCGSCNLAIAPSKLDVVSPSRISPYRVVTGQAVARSPIPSVGNGWALGSILLGDPAAASGVLDKSLAVLPDSVCGDVALWTLTGATLEISPTIASGWPRNGSELGVVFEYYSPTDYAAAGIRALSTDFSLGAQHEAFIRLHDGTEETRPIFIDTAGKLNATPVVWRRGDWLFVAFQQTQSAETVAQLASFDSIPAPTVPRYVTRSVVPIESPRREDAWTHGVYALGVGSAIAGSVKRHNLGLDTEDAFYQCGPVPPFFGPTVNNSYPKAVGGKLDGSSLDGREHKSGFAFADSLVDEDLQTLYGYPEGTELQIVDGSGGWPYTPTLAPADVAGVAIGTGGMRSQVSATISAGGVFTARRSLHARSTSGPNSFNPFAGALTIQSTQLDQDAPESYNLDADRMLAANTEEFSFPAFSAGTIATNFKYVLWYRSGLQWRKADVSPAESPALPAGPYSYYWLLERDAEVDLSVPATTLDITIDER